MNEQKMIEKISGIHGQSPFLSDAELFGKMLYSMDSFSKTEDFFEITPPETVGHNMAAAACSDLLACGAKPEFLIQTWNIDDSEPEEFYLHAARGIESVLNHYGAKCIGGDMGCSSPWSWTATVGGTAKTAPVQRRTDRKIPFDLYLSGSVGDANIAAFFHREMPRIELREPVPAHALFATDTSGGFFDALENFRRLEPQLSIEIETIPYTEHEPLPFPEEFLLIGGVGEYELLYAVPAGCSADGIRIGTGDFSGSGIRFKNGGIMKSPPPDYREIPPDQWVVATEQYYREVFQ